LKTWEFFGDRPELLYVTKDGKKIYKFHFKDHSFNIRKNSNAARNNLATLWNEPGKAPPKIAKKPKVKKEEVQIVQEKAEVPNVKKEIVQSLDETSSSIDLKRSFEKKFKIDTSKIDKHMRGDVDGTEHLGTSITKDFMSDDANDEARELNFESGQVSAIIFQKNETEQEPGKFNHIYCEFDDIFEDTLSLRLTGGGAEFKDKEKVGAFVKFVYNKESASLKLSGFIDDVDELEESTMIYLKVNKDSKEMESFLKLYEKRQENLSNFFDTLKGVDED